MYVGCRDSTCLRISTAQSIDQMLEDTFSLGKLSYKAYDQGGVTNLFTNQYNAEVLEIIKSNKVISPDSSIYFTECN